MFLSAIFTPHQSVEMTKCPPTDKWVNETLCIHTTEYRSGTQWKKAQAHATMWVTLENTVLIERRLTHEVPYHRIPFVGYFDNRQIYSGRRLIRGGLGLGGGGATSNGYGVCLHMFWKLAVAMVTLL